MAINYYENQSLWVRKSIDLTLKIMMITSTFYVIAGFGVRHQIPIQSLYAVYGFGLIQFLIGAFLYQLKLNEKNISVHFISILAFINIIILFNILWLFGTNRTFKTEAQVIMYIWAVLPMLSANKYNVAIVSTIITAGYILQLFVAIVTKSIELGTITEAFNTSKVSVANEGLKIFFFVMFSTIIYIVTDWLHNRFIDQHKMDCISCPQRAKDTELKVGNLI